MLDPTQWFVLVHAAHGRTAHDRACHNVNAARMLNVNGRWSTRPTQLVPVLIWRDRGAAEASATICRKHRTDAIVVSSIGGTAFELGRHLVEFGPAHEPALAGYLPYGPAASAKEDADRRKALASAAFLLARAHGDAALVAKAHELSPRAGSGATDFLTGKRGRGVAQAILSGRLAADEVVTSEVLQSALDLAQAIAQDRLQRDEATGRFRP